MNNRSMISIFLVFFIFAISCKTISYTPNQLEYPVTFSNIPNKGLKTFKTKLSYWYWGRIELGEHKSIDDAIRDEIKKVPDATGVKNLEIKPYDTVFAQGSWSASYGFVPAFTGIGFTLINMFGFYNKRVWIYGEIY